MNTQRHSPIVLAAVMACALVSGCFGQSSGSENKIVKVKTAYLLNFLKFCTWPATAFEETEKEKAPIVVIALGGDSAVADLLTSMIDAKEIHSRDVVIKHIQYPEDAPPRADQDEEEAFSDQIASAHVLYVDKSLKDKIPAILEKAGADTLTVSDSPGFAAGGGMLGLVRKDDKIVFEANTDAIGRSGIQISSKVLKLARVVMTREEE